MTGSMFARHSIRPPRRARGFTLIEAALTTVIVGVAFVAIMQLFAACTQQNRIGQNMTTAMLLAGHIQETMAGLSFNDPAYATTYFGPEPGQTPASYDDVDDFDGAAFSPPIDSRRQQIIGQTQYTQMVTVQPVLAMQPSSNADPTVNAIPKSTYTGCVRVTVRILYRTNPTDTAVEVYRTSWLRVDN
jgi:type II secretory pathway pseudopilin PulG